MSVTFSPQEVAKRHGIDRGKVLKWIDGGQLPAINVATNPNGRPRWRIP
jgi:excisionase family DNA binding protein